MHRPGLDRRGSRPWACRGPVRSCVQDRLGHAPLCGSSGGAPRAEEPREALSDQPRVCRRLQLLSRKEPSWPRQQPSFPLRSASVRCGWSGAPWTGMDLAGRRSVDFREDRLCTADPERVGQAGRGRQRQARADPSRYGREDQGP
jgi:hypothetical protein